MKSSSMAAVSRARVRVRELAKESGEAIDLVLLAGIDAGARVSGADDFIPRNKLSAVRRRLGLAGEPNPPSVAELANRAGLSLEEARRALRADGIVPSGKAGRVPKSALRRAEFALGLRVASAVPKSYVGSPDAASSPSNATIVEAHPKKLKIRRTKRPTKPVWPIIGKRQDAILLTAGDVIEIHWLLVKHFAKSRDPIDPPGVRDETLEDALYDYVLRLADHALLSERADRPDSDQEVIEVARWLQRHTRMIRKGELPIPFRELRRILTSYGATFELIPGNRMNIFCDGKRTQIFYGDEGRDVEPNSVHRVRAQLELDEDHGYDSDIFYNAGPRIPEFINRYRRILERLAKV
jgi:hypothetical protein